MAESAEIQSSKMSKPSIEYINPTSRALGRMTTILFRPFDIGKWFVLGFTAWLATLMDNGNSSGGNVQVGDSDEASQPESFEEFIEPARNYVMENLSWLVPLVVTVVVLVLILSLILLWLSSRGKFMFLDNVVHNRALVKAPWREFRAAGNSLFKWRLVFGLIVFLLAGGIIGGAAIYLVSTFEEGNIQPTWIVVLVSSILVLFTLLIVASYISMLLEDFVISMMYRDGLSVSEAWRRVLALHNSQPGRFVLYYLWKALLVLATGIVIIAAILITCCVALIFLIIPYIGAVVMLPVTVFFRGLGPEFLRQFGDEYDLWHGSEDNFGFAPPPLPTAEG